MIRLNVAFIAFNLLRFFINLFLKHLKVVDKVIKYLYIIRYLGIAYKGGFKEV